MNLKRYLLPALLAALLAACSGDRAGTALPAAPQLSEAETNAAFGDLGRELVGTMFSMNGDASSVALQQLPAHATGFPLANDGEDYALPRGSYVYDEASDSWQLAEEGDYLTLTWSYSGVEGAADAVLSVDWDADGETANVAGPTGEMLEAPTAFNVTLTAADQEVADVDFALTYYNTDECGTAAGIAEPTSLSVNGAGSLLTLENVGYSVLENASENGADTVTTQGEVTFNKGEGITLEWTLGVTGEREREDCFTSDYVPTGGNVDVSLTSDAGSFALGVNVGSVDLENKSATLSDGALRINNTLAVSFAGTLDDANGNGVPGENVVLTFAGGQSATLEEVLQSSKVGMMMRGLRR